MERNTVLVNDSSLQEKKKSPRTQVYDAVISRGNSIKYLLIITITLLGPEDKMSQLLLSEP